MSIAESMVDVGAVRLNVATAGPPDGPAVLLLHGFPDRWALWRHQIPALAGAGFRVIAPDLRGMGDSDRPAETEAYGFAHVLGDVVALLDTQGIGRVHVVGHDFGAALAWVMTRYLADRIASLTALSVGHGGAWAAAGEEQRRRSWYMLWFQFPGVAEQVLPRSDWAALRAWAGEHAELDRQIADLSRPGALTAGLNWYRANLDPSVFVRVSPPSPGRITPVDCPTLGVWSDRDPFLAETQMTASHEFVTGPWRYERLEGVGHWIPTQAPDRLTPLLLDFLQGA